jgi:hypothetical protein
MIRLALAAIVLCSTLCAALGQTQAGRPAMPEPSRDARVSLVPLECTPADDEGEWKPLRNAKASIPESAGRWRTLHAGFAATVRLEFVPKARAYPSDARASDAPSYLLHTPLLI